MHLKLHGDKLKEEDDKEQDCTNESSDDSSDAIQLKSREGIAKKLRGIYVHPKKKKWKKEEGLFNPFDYDGCKSNVFNISINFVPTYEGEMKNRKISETN